MNSLFVSFALHLIWNYGNFPFEKELIPENMTNIHPDYIPLVAQLIYSTEEVVKAGIKEIKLPIQQV
jgi:hypothetical protein